MKNFFNWQRTDYKISDFSDVADTVSFTLKFLKKNNVTMKQVYTVHDSLFKKKPT